MPLAVPTGRIHMTSGSKRACNYGRRGGSMLDVIFVALGVGGFAVCLAYVYICDRL